jgi:hypothetical protein
MNLYLCLGHYPTRYSGMTVKVSTPLTCYVGYWTKTNRTCKTFWQQQCCPRNGFYTHTHTLEKAIAFCTAETNFVLHSKQNKNKNKQSRLIMPQIVKKGRKSWNFFFEKSSQIWKKAGKSRHKIWKKAGKSCHKIWKKVRKRLLHTWFNIYQLLAYFLNVY